MEQLNFHRTAMLKQHACTGAVAEDWSGSITAVQHPVQGDQPAEGMARHVGCQGVRSDLTNVSIVHSQIYSVRIGVLRMHWQCCVDVIECALGVSSDAVVGPG